MSKYEKMFQTMLDDCSDLFSEFQTLHDQVKSGDIEQEEEFYTVGSKVLRVIRRYENDLCSKSENSRFGKFSENLSEKFWELVRLKFPLIDTVGQR